MDAPLASTDTVSAFRFICGAGQLAYDDPLVYPGQPGKSHLHQFYGNLSADANSTFDSLRHNGMTTCGDPTKLPGNRSAYWMPALLDGHGHVVQPDSVAIYYKRYPSSSPRCNDGYTLQCVAIPNGLRFIFGRDMLNLQAPPTGSYHWICMDSTEHPIPGSSSAGYPTITQAIAVPGCVATGNILIIQIDAPNCWDGANLDSPNHRDHVADPIYQGGLDYPSCPKSHPYMIPTFKLGARYHFADGDTPQDWVLSSDAMDPSGGHGSTFHTDYFEAWDANVKQMWTDNCLDKHLSCQNGNLGNGEGLLNAWSANYLVNGVWQHTNTNPVHMVPVPPMPAM